jgi:hypothetical protein
VAVDSHFHRNPFFVLGATTHDDRKKLVELAAARSLEFESGVCEEARAELTRSRKRLAAEIAWFPGVPPSAVAALIELLRTDLEAVRRQSNLPDLVRANLLAAVWQELPASPPTLAIPDLIVDTGAVIDRISAAAVMRDVNQDRAISGFAPIQSIEEVEVELAERLRFVCSLIRGALDLLPSESIVEAMRRAVAAATDSGQRQASALVDELIDTYEIDTRTVMEQEAAAARRLIESVRDKMARGSAAMQPYLRQLGTVVHNWDRIAQPIQLSYLARGLSHRPSLDLGYAVRNLAIELWNQYRVMEESTRLILLSEKLFAEIPPLVDLLKEDRTALASIAESLTYRTDVGRFLKHTLSISADAVQWKRQHYRLESITRIRWGAETRTFSGVVKRTTYTVAFGDAERESCIETRNKEIYQNFIGKLWSTAGIRLLSEFMEILKAGGVIRYGRARFSDEGVELMQIRPFGRKQVVSCAWDQVVVKNFNGSLTVSAKANSSAWAMMSFRDTANVYVLAKALELVLQPPFKQKMSALLR